MFNSYLKVPSLQYALVLYHLHYCDSTKKGRGLMKVDININGQAKKLEVEKGTPLLWVIRDEVGLTGTKFGCGVASCGNCTVHLDGKPVKSCAVNVEQVENREVTTIEGLNGPVASAVRQAWVRNNVVQCGFCQSGQIMSATAFLTENKSPSDSDINLAMAGNACRCMCYTRIKDAIGEAAKMLEA